MSVNQDNTSITDRAMLLDTLQREQTKQHIVWDGAQPQFIFEAPINAGEGDACLVTELVYFPSSSVVKDRQERVYRWKAAWDSDFVFDPNANYDPDGDGSL